MSGSTASHSEQVEKLRKLIKGIEIAMFTTAMPDGSLRSRPMATQKAEFDGDLWFFCDADSAKVHEVERDRHVNLGYADPSGNRYVSVSGLANVVRDKAKVKELWTPDVKAWFPNGPDDLNIALLKVSVQGAEYWDAPSNTMVRIAGFLKATLTGQRYEPGENEKVNLK